MSSEDNGNVSSGNNFLKPTSSSTEDLSEYTDADESISAPTEFLAEFLSAVMLKDYETALKYCKLILQYEPNNVTAKEFYPLIIEKLQNNYNKEHQVHIESNSSESETSSNSGAADDENLNGSGEAESSCTDSSSGDDDDDEDEEDDDDEDEDGEEEEEEEVNRHTKSGSSDGDATTASYSSLEDDELETEHLMNLAKKFTLDNAKFENGNKPACKFAPPQTKSSPQRIIKAVPSSDSESPTEPVSQQQTIAMLRARVLPTKN